MRLLFFVLLLISQINAQPRNYCDISITHIIRDTSSEKENIPTFIFKLNNEKNTLEASKLINIIIKRPYYEPALIELLDLIEKDRENIETGEKYVDALVANEKAIEHIMDSIIFIESKEARKKAKEFILYGKRYKKFNSLISEPTYKNYMALTNVNYFEFVEDKSNFMAKIQRNDFPEDRIYSVLYTMITSPSKKNIRTRMYGSKNYYRQLTNFYKSSCTNTEAYNAARNRVGLKETLKLFFLSHGDTNSKDNMMLKKLYFATNGRSGSWEYLEYLFGLLTTNHELTESSITMVDLYFDHKDDFINRKAVLAYMDIANKSFSSGDNVKAWDYSIKIIDKTLFLNDKTQADISLAIKAKRIMQEASKKIVERYSANYEVENAKHVFAKTTEMLNVMF